MDRTPNLDIPYLLPSQAQKHVTHNEALKALDTVVQLAVLDRDLAAPPADPGEGDRYIVAAGASGVWAGHDAEIAVWLDGAWQFFAPGEGWFAWAADESLILVHAGGAWTDLGSVLGVYQNLALLGVGTTADANNPLSAKLNDALFTAKYASEGGDGDLRIKANKEAAAGTASYLFQTNFSGRAEFGLIGDDDFRIKVSADGSAWNDALVIAKATGEVTFPNTSIGGGGGGRQLLTANRTYYVRSDGDDGNDGLTNDSAGAFLTIQKAVDVVGTLDLGVYDATVQIGVAGTYAGAVISAPFVGGAGSSVSIVGDTGSPASHAISSAIQVLDNAALRIRGVDFTSGGYGIDIRNGGSVLVDGAVIFGACANSHIHLINAGRCEIAANYTIDGSAPNHVNCNLGSVFLCNGRVITLTGTPEWSSVGHVAADLAAVRVQGNTYSGAATGTRYFAGINGTINTNGGGANYLPGNSAGSATSGGQYV